MKRKILYTLCAIFVLMIILTIPSFAATGTVNTETLNLRKEQSTSSTIIELLSQYDKVEILATEGEWYKVSHGDNTGYVKMEYIKVAEEANENVSNSINTDITETNSDETQATVDSGKGIINKNVKVHLLPVINSNTIGSLNSNDEVEIITRTNNWALAQNNNITGWIPLAAIKKDDSTANTNEVVNDPTTETNEPNNSEEISSTSTTYDEPVIKYISSSSVYMRNKASTESSIVTTLIKNTDVTVLGEEGQWYSVKYGDKYGFIRKDLLADTKVEETSRGGDIDRNNNDSSTSEQALNENINNNENNSLPNLSLENQIVEYAKQYLGCPYVYGAAGNTSFDCSGFTMYVYSHFGYSLSHSATAQSKVGTYVSKENLQVGDLVFFLDYETMDGIGHCGIYIGNGEFIHASSGSGYCVKVSTLTSGSYYNRYATARRLI